MCPEIRREMCVPNVTSIHKGIICYVRGINVSASVASFRLRKGSAAHK